MAHASHRPDVVCASSEAASVAAGGYSSLPIPVASNVVGYALVATGSSNRGYFGSTTLPQTSVAWIVTDTSAHAQSRRRVVARHIARLRAQSAMLHNFYAQKLPRDAYVFFHNRRMYAHPDHRRPTTPVTTAYPGGESPFLPDPPEPTFLQGPAEGTIWDMQW